MTHEQASEMIELLHKIHVDACVIAGIGGALIVLVFLMYLSQED